MTQQQREEKPLMEQAVIELMQQEVSQRLLAIRMNTALHSRQSEGRKTQLLADQTVSMVDEVIGTFDDMLTLMKLALPDASREFPMGCQRLTKLFTQLSGSACALSGAETVAARSSTLQEKTFRLLYRCLLHLLLRPEHLQELRIEICAEPVITLVFQTETDTPALHHLALSLQAEEDVQADYADTPSSVRVLQVSLINNEEKS